MRALPQPAEPRHGGYVETPSMILPAAPPPRVSAAIDAALQRAEALAQSGREMAFTVDAAGELRIEVRDLAGAVIEVLGATEALSVMGGLERV